MKGACDMKNITVEPEQLISCAVLMENQNQEYERDMRNLFDEVDRMQSSWQGKDNQAFTAEIKKFEADFKLLSVLCMQYADFLKTTARAYTETQEELASQASRVVM